MAASLRLPNLIRHLPTLGGAAAGTAAATAVALTPLAKLESLVWDSGLAAFFPAAEPPLGATARLLLVDGAAAATAAVVWAALYLLFGPGGLLAPEPMPVGGVPTLRRADAHPDAPPRPPMTAADLGTPLMEVTAPPPAVAPEPRAAAPSVAEDVPLAIPASLGDPWIAARTEERADTAEPTPRPRQPEPLPPLAAIPVPAPAPRPLPRDLDQPLAAFAAPEPLAPGERLQTFALRPAVPAGTAPAAPRQPASQQTIESLLRRLEESAGRRLSAG